MKITELLINPKSVGRGLILTGIRPAYEYRNGQRTDNVVGYKYDVVLPDHGYSPLSIRIDGEQLLEYEEGAHAEVTFDGLDLYIYWLNQQYSVGARATGVHLVASKQTKVTS